MSEELKPCPFCGPGTNLQIFKHGPDDPDCFAQCDACTSCGPSGKSYEEAAVLWNRRTPAAQPAPASTGREPVAWAVTAERGGIHKLSITRESAERKHAKWLEEWPNNNSFVRPLVFGDVAARELDVEAEQREGAS